MAINENVKRQAMSAVSQVKPNIEQVHTTGSAVNSVQPALDESLANLETSRVPDWRDTQGLESMREEKREMQRDINAPGE